MDCVRVHPGNSSRTASLLGLSLVVLLQVVLFLLELKPAQHVAVVGLVAAAAYLAAGNALGKLVALAVLAASLLVGERPGLPLRPDALIPLAVLTVWLAGRAVGSLPDRYRLSAIEKAIMVLLACVLVAAVHGLILGRPWQSVWDETQTYLYFGLALVVARSGIGERDVRRIVAVILLATTVISVSYGLVFLRSAGTRRPATDQQHMLNVAIPLLVAYLFLFRRVWHRVLAIAALVLMAYATYASLTRALWLYVPFSLILLLALLALHRHIRLPRRLFGLGVLFVLAVLALRGPQTAAPAAHGAVAERAETLGNLKYDLSLIARYDFALQVLDRWRRSPLLGSGLGDYVRYRIPGTDQNSRFYLLDSSYLQVLWKFGLLGLLPFLVLYFLFLRRVWQVYRRAQSEFMRLTAAAVFVSLVTLVIIGIESGILVVYRFNLVWAVLIGIFEHWGRELDSRPAVLTPVPT